MELVVGACRAVALVELLQSHAAERQVCPQGNCCRHRAERSRRAHCCVLQILRVKTFDLILADPPWRYNSKPPGKREVEIHYPTMTDEEIKQLPIGDLGHDSTVLFLWATAPKLIDALKVMKRWGWQYVTNAVWDKEKIGIGYWFRGQHELLLVGRRKRTPATPIEHRISSVFREMRRRHSQKPDCVYGWIEAAWPDASKLELFCRTPREGWSVWGNEVHSTINLKV